MIGLAFIIVVLFGTSRFFGRGGGFCGGRRYDGAKNLRREIRDLKDEIAKLRMKE